jgi:hypothetical protein
MDGLRHAVAVLSPDIPHSWLPKIQVEKHPADDPNNTCDAYLATGCSSKGTGFNARLISHRSH